MHKNLLINLAFLFFSIPVLSQQANDIEGFWYLHSDDAGNIPIGHMTHKNTTFYLYTIALKNSHTIQNDVHNPNVNKRALSMKGLIIVSDLKFDTKNKIWKSGKIYNPANGKIYNFQLKLSKDKQHINARASVDEYGIFGKTFEWTRATQNQYQPLPDKQLHQP